MPERRSRFAERLLSHDEPHTVTVGIARQCAGAESERQWRGRHRSRRDQGDPVISREREQRLEPFRRQRRLPMSDVVRVKIDGCRPAIARREIFKELNARSLSRAQRGDSKSRAEYVVQVFLFDVVVLAFAGNLHAERVAIEAQRSIRVVDHDRRVIDPHEQSPRGFVPSRLSFVRRERDDFDEVPVGIAKVEGADTTGIRIPVGKPLRTGRGVLDPVLLQPLVRLRDVADHDRDVLEETIVGTDIRRNGSSFRRQKLGELGLGLNFLAIPLMAVAQVAGMAVVPLTAVSTSSAAVVGWIAHVGAAGLVWSADLVRFVPALTYRVAAPSFTAIAVYYVALVGWWCTTRHASSIDRRLGRRLGRTCGLLAAAAALWILVDPRTFAAARGDGRLHVTFLDVGQGDSAFVVFPHGATMLVDTGGLSASSSFDIGDRVVAPVIRTAGFRRIDWLALTHGDPDHIGGAASVVREFRPREVWEGIPVPRFEPLTALRLAVQGSGARWANVYSGDHVTIDGVEVVARHPGRADWERQRVRNDDSLVLDLRWGDVSIVLTGDIGKAVEGDIAAVTAPARLRVVKVPHHGSLTSSTPAFVRALKPQIAVVSAGRANHFGHPVPEILDRYRAVGAEVFRTDQDGAVMVESDGVSIAVRTFTGRRLSLH